MNSFKCHRARVSFELYLDGDLSAEDCEVLEQHLFECSACASAIGDDVQLAEAIQEASRSGIDPFSAAPIRQQTWRGVGRVAAAAVLLMVGAAIGHLTTRDAPKSPEPLTRVSENDLVPLTEVVEEPAIGFASFTDTELLEAEREGLRSKVGQSEWRARRAETQMDLMRPLLEETATPARVVERLAERLRQVSPGGPLKPPREDRDRMRGPFHQVYVAASLLRRDPEAAFEPVTAWLRSAQSPLERRHAVKLLGLLRLPKAHDVLVAESQEGPARDLALDGLVVLREPRSHALFTSLMDDERLPLETIRVKAAGGLHRLGDPRGLEFLVKTFRARDADSDQPLRKRILIHVGANPGRETAAVLPELLDGVVLHAPERAQMAEWLSLSGMSDADPNLLRIVDSERRRVRAE